MIKLEIVTPEKKALEEVVDMVTIPTASGEIGILPSHAPLISAIQAGILSYTKGGTTNRLVISGGFVEVGNNKVSVLTDIAETATEINVENARLEKGEAEKVLGTWSGSEEDFELEKEKLGRAEARLQLAAGK
ncbi:MAG TPA: F0F1 ATP synthase subunit epsilon [Pyrinomonadaceae bacterium]|nr:F0F1 ATP synthase subunit epsilon [Pyrinomonadaceae bacterium]